ncbi:MULTISPECIES: SDR family oxidoreductase [unclassified Ensifer]|uniref:dTDP-4-dehydrorhamnose reductase family protein n=1 Tax=unclassified Ensifer TaxID=2633371 RepID=UPI0008131F16|nr:MULTISPECIES: SDR family oxidoreductase [unclassified Ensifer]OCP18649.1 NAD(P)-dependent oxidoreductase [Ensifer sp. LC54]OCP18684.1 NAD(P)-dependent oxidoreductase [Ensifer sp. LC384]
MKVLVLGVTGMLGHVAYRELGRRPGIEAFGTARSLKPEFSGYFDASNIMLGVDVLDNDSLIRVFEAVRPDVIINCVGVIKQLGIAKDPLYTIPINSLLPHKLANLASLIGARVIHISTDCVFVGDKGNYSETDEPDAKDLYGVSKYLGELHGDNCLTIRTSIIGPELGSKNGLVAWFLNQKGPVKGYTEAFFSGFPTIEITNIIADKVLPNKDLHGLFNVSADRISKYDLLSIVNEQYGCGKVINPDEALKIDRSLDSSRFRQVTGYTPPAWPELIARMKTTAVDVRA